jgi:hypothetical protein
MKLASSAALVSVLAGQGQHVSGLRGASAPGRNLQDDPRQVKLTKMEWPECIGMPAADCARIVRREAKRHEIKDLSVKVVVPRTKEEIRETYIKVGTSIFAHNNLFLACSLFLHFAHTSYFPFVELQVLL